MQRILALVMVLMMLMTVVGCNDTVSSPENGATVTDKEDTVLTDADETKVVQKSDFTIVTTGQVESFDKDGNVIEVGKGDIYYGQDAQYDSAGFSFTANGDGTVTDNNTGLMWQVIPIDEKMSWEEAIEYCESLELAGYDDWRLPSAKELFSLSNFEVGWPFLDTDYFEFPDVSAIAGGDTSPQGGGPQGGSPQGGSPQGDTNTKSEKMPPPPTTETDGGEGSISKMQGQFWSSNFYEVGTTHGGAPTAFGVNHATGHIKGYPSDVSGPMGKCVRAVRGEEYGINDFVDNGDGTVTDKATGLMWMQVDAEKAMEWSDALAYAEDFESAGYDDWRLPDVKELQSIVDYSGLYPAINQSYFEITELAENENYYFWTGTSAYFSPADPGYGYAWYVAFGYAVGDDGEDSHGAGAVRFSPKYEESEYAGEGGDNILNSVRLVRTVQE